MNAAVLATPIRLSMLLEIVAQDCADLGKITFGELIVRLEDRATLILLGLVALPFITPVPTAGLSMPFGLAAAFIGCGMMLNRKPPWPQRLLRLPLPAGLISRLVRAGSRIWTLIDRLLRPRCDWIVHSRPWNWAHGSAAVVSGVLLALPLPIPFANALPAITLLLIAAGLAQRDGLALLAAHVCFIVTLAFFASLAWLGWEGIQQMLLWWT